MRALHACLLATFLAAGCGTDTSGQELLAGFDPGPAPDNGLQIVLPIVRGLEPGVSRELCSWTSVKVDRPMDIRKIEAFQAIAGHHVALFLTKVPMPEGTTHDCTDADMTNFRIVAGSSQGYPTEAPGNLVYRLPEGMYLAIQQHYINAGDLPVDSQSALNLYFADPGVAYTPSQALAFVNTDIDLPPGASSVDISCTMPQDIKAWFAIPHMHKYGASFRVEQVHAGQTTQLLDMPAWDEGFEFHPPEQRWDVNAPLVFAAGDEVHVHCGWNNTTDKALKFGNEMCVFFAETIDDTGLGNLACNNGDWTDF